MNKKKSLAQRLAGQVSRGVLTENPPEVPFWIPEDNPLLSAWDMTLNEYCRAVQRAVGQNPRPSCTKAFRRQWPDLDTIDWNLSLINVLGRAWRLFYPNSGGELLGEAPEVYIQWNTGPAPNTDKLQDKKALFEAMACLMLKPFAQMEKRREKPAERKKHDERT